MQNVIKVSKDLYYLGGNDRRLALFESAFPVPRGVSYNSYLLTDENTVDSAVCDLFLENLEAALAGRPLDYFVIHHMEPDHSASVMRLIEKYPEATVVTNRKVEGMLKNYFPFPSERIHLVAEGDTMSVGRRSVTFVFAPMVHWPEVMMSYIPEDGILFSADAFGTFGALSGAIFADQVQFERDFLDDARRYYFNIVGKYGVQVQSVLKKAAGLDLRLVCPLHGPVWRENFSFLLKKYDLWSKYLPEEKGVAVFYASVYGHTMNAAEILAGAIAKQGVFVKVYDVSHTHVSELLSEAFRYSHAVFCSTTYNNGIFITMEDFLRDLKAHNYQNRKYAIVENGSWSPQAGAYMQAELAAMKNLTQIGEKVTLLSAVKEDSAAALTALADEIAKDVNS